MDQQSFDEFIRIFKQYNYFDQHHGLRFEIMKLGLIHYRLNIEEKHLSTPGFCHGGVLSGMMDATLGLAALSLAIQKKKICSTVEFKINYLNPVRLGDKIIGEGKIDFFRLVSEGNLNRQKENRAFLFFRPILYVIFFL